ncbi:MAG: hypothetical protein WCC87_18730 [Candidatus Korobacteraceae bacterium]
MAQKLTVVVTGSTGKQVDRAALRREFPDVAFHDSRVRRQAFDPTLTLFVKEVLEVHMEIGVALRLTGLSFVMALAG